MSQPLITKDWANLSKREAQLLLGLTKEFGLLGSMQGAGTAKNVFLEGTTKNLATRRAIQEQILLLRKVPLNKNFPLAVRKAHEVIANRNGFSTGVTTRLLALARPEALVSVNNESSKRLSELSGFPEASIRTSQGYEKLISWVMSGRWWDAPAPLDSDEKEIWNYRAALLDSLVYEGHFFQAHS